MTINTYTMKKTILILLTGISLAACARQNTATASPRAHDAPGREKVESMRIAFITQKLDLSPDEAQKFWPVYNEFQKKRLELHKKRKEEFKDAKGSIDSLSDKQAEAMVDGEMAFRQKNLDLEKEYHSKFKSVLPIKKVAKLYRAEDMFAHRLLERISERGRAEHGGRKDDGAPHARPNPEEEK
jgi:Spy/CpxP family protein refolding chaperone